MGESITSGILAAWQVKDGDFVEAGQTLYELETDKVTSEGTADVSGRITLKASEGDEVQIGQVVATIDESATGDKQADQPDEGEETADDKKEAPSAASDKESSGDQREAPGKTSAKSKGHPPSPAVRRIAAETGVDPAAVDGSGKDGRVTKGDMLQAAQAKPEPQAGEPTARPQPADKDNERSTRRKMSPMRRKIAERMVAVGREAALLTTFNEVDMSRIISLRKQHQERFVEKHGIKLGFMSFFVKAVVNALREVPAINARIEGDEIVYNNFYDVGVAVGTDKGLLVPVVRDCEQKGFAAIESDILDFAKAARAGKIKVEDLQGGVFTISNGGIYGSMLSTPLLNLPQSGILGLHNITERPVAVNGEVVIRPMMYLALSYDHRLVDGKEAVTFLLRVKEAIENPERLLLEL